MRKLNLKLCFLTLVFSCRAFAADPPDISKESEFHRIYKSFNEEPTSLEVWDQALSTRNVEIYNVQRGDTLSGISTTLFGDQFFWPKLWSLNNQQILNPHEISPGMVVQFFPGSTGEAPAFQVAEPKKEEKSGAEDSGNKVQGIAKVPPPNKKRAPVLREFPKSLPAFNSILGLVKQKEQIQVELNKVGFRPGKEPLSYYIADQPIEGAGVIVGVEMGLETAGDFQYVFVKLNESSEKKFTVQKNLGKVSDTDSWWRRGNIVEVQGEIEIIHKVNNDKNLYRAIVKRAITQVEVGSLLTPGPMPLIDPNPGPLGPNLESSIIGGQYDKKRKLFGSHSFVYLNGGESKGLKEGQTLVIFAEERVRNNKVDAFENNRIIGHLKVVKVTPYFATAYITHATDDIVIGDHVGKPGAQARLDIKEDEIDKSLEEEEFEATPSSEPDTKSDSEDADLDL